MPGLGFAGAPDKWAFNLPLAASTRLTTPGDLARFGAHLAGEIRRGGPHAPMADPAVTVGEKDGVEAGWGLTNSASGKRVADAVEQRFFGRRIRGVSRLVADANGSRAWIAADLRPRSISTPTSCVRSSTISGRM